MTPCWPRLSWVAPALAVALGWIFSLNGPSHASDPRSIDWRADLPRARSEAGSRNRLVWLQFTGPWCQNCRRMEAESFTDPRVIGHAGSDFIPVKLRADEHEELALGFGLSCLPATVILRASGEVVAKVQGYLGAESYLEFLQGTLTRDGRLPSARASVDDRDGRGRASRGPVLGGYCLVSLVDGHRLVAGRPEHAFEHEGRVYLFATSEGRLAFERNPELYVPVNAGRCPVAQVDRGESRAGSPSWGVLYDGHLFLCGDESDRRRFLDRPERYARVDVADRGFCPHCWVLDGLLVRGRPSYALNRGGRRYLFPDPSHLEAFRTTSPTAHR
jgi:YHS domain-containing protein